MVDLCVPLQARWFTLKLCVKSMKKRIGRNAIKELGNIILNLLKEPQYGKRLLNSFHNIRVIALKNKKRERRSKKNVLLRRKTSRIIRSVAGGPTLS